MAALDLAGPSFRTLAPLSRCKHGIHCSVNLEGKSLLARGKFLSLIGTSKDRKRRNALSMSVAVRCNASEVSVAGSAMEMEKGWVPVVPLAALPRGERRLVRQNNEEILLLWYKNDVVGIENKSPAEGAYSEGLINAKLTPDGCIVCPTTDSTFNLKTGEIMEWYPKNPVLRVLTPPLRKLFIYPTKVESDYIYINMGSTESVPEAAEIVFSGKTQAGLTASDVNVDEVRMVVDESESGFGFTRKNELINGRAATVGFLLLLNFELLTGKGLLKGTGFLDFLYAASQALSQ
uniref:TSA: Wollemia nobilis Ref_Wollemi_Transcript_3137_1220 transcribed RNA sequence n=1 Tax=Wollemia nobilis TaxID=56998 RepID=A0A0C9SAJ1_9CONI